MSMKRITRPSSQGGAALFSSRSRLALLGVYLGRERLFSSPAPKHLTARVARADMENVVLATGTLQPIREVDVGTRATGQLTSLKVKLGDHVRAGDLLAEIDPVARRKRAEGGAGETDRSRSPKALPRPRNCTSHLLGRPSAQHGLIRGAATSTKDVQTADAQRKADEAGIVSLDAQISQAQSRIDDRDDQCLLHEDLRADRRRRRRHSDQEGQTVVASQIVPVILKLAQLDVIIVKTKSQRGGHRRRESRTIGVLLT